MPNEVVTLTVAYLLGNSNAVSLSFADSLGNSASVVSSTCSSSTPAVCTAVGYFFVTTPGYDDIFFTEQGGSAGELWYNAEIWQGQFFQPLSTNGASSSCPQSCSGTLSLGPLQGSTAVAGAIAVSVYAAYYPYTPATWQPGYPQYYTVGDSQPQGGDSILWQAIASPLQTYQFGAATSPTPVAWSGSGEVLSWTHP